MGSMTSEINLNYYHQAIIALAVKNLAGEAISLRAVVDELHDATVNYYNGDLFADYKRGWIQAVVEYSKSKQVDNW